MTPPESSFDSQKYWMARHEQYAGSHQATGLLGSSEQANAVLYELRRRALLACLRGMDLTGARVLDAGCGLGDFSRLYHQLGAEVYGCDVSPRAVEQCREHVSGVFECGGIIDVPGLFPNVRFDLVHCFDVLYHLMDDAEWQSSLQALQAVSAPAATWRITEIVRPVPGANHIRPRQRSMYDPQLARLGRGITEERRLHWLLSIRPSLHSRLPALSMGLEPLCRIWPLASVARVALWSISADRRSEHAGVAEGGLQQR